MDLLFLWTEAFSHTSVLPCFVVIVFKRLRVGFPDDSVVKNFPANAGDTD